VNRTKSAFDIMKEAARKFGAENGAMMAAAVSSMLCSRCFLYYCLVLRLLGYIVGSSERAFSSVVNFLDSFMPTSTFITETLRGLVSLRGVIAGLVSLRCCGPGASSS